MTVPESSLSRWSRLKHEAVSKRQADTGQDDTLAGSAGPENTEPETGSGEGPVDPVELPSVDTITIDTDIRAFLKSQVPAELTRAALRRAWISDPAIRDFVGIAENQWDFNDRTAISGFGPLFESDDVPALLAQAFGQPADPVTAMAELATALEAPAEAGIVTEIAAPDLPDPPAALSETADEGAAVEQPVAELEGGAPPKRRTHGGALPR
ncbi:MULTISPECIES: DUF3306 domain-containing protein [Bradyrhizobium]|uniref:DUF3306 domain-containing protein n=1 Tax=Bradyrhizobium canariense TaxID=255045 RepID=A0A1X3FD28_9BRAD|nr:MULTISPECIES: DUF3306 domain-containing protein [Bradyrhizobium]OSI64657.1 hypothetical protein BSZ22_32230 [Bradyrhizobium canariense]OSI79185.1 hypothetical protein BSZ23_15635 [Bradyrhizobium canariense]OSI90711.1 hypothetical protein BSZ24_19555 [Bradyrhizobium canariense]OSI91629.1 hypothetical protein BSZ25_14535 [Bradyrhizobium canariense]OSJ03695.1 hypothetical protein BSZ18_30760 [Bradyrhizobium canariense]